MVEFKRGQEVTTPLGEGIVDGYGKPAGHAPFNYTRVWVWVKEPVEGRTLHSLPIEVVKLKPATQPAEPAN